MQGHVACLSQLKDKGVDKNVVYKGTTPLHRALEKDNVDLARILVAFGTKPTTKDANGETPIILAARTGVCELIVYFINSGASKEDVDRDSRTIASYAFESGKPEFLASISYGQGCDLNRPDNSGMAPIHYAVKNRRADFLATYVFTQVPPNALNLDARARDGKTPLLMAAELGLTPLVAALIEKKVDAAAVDNEGNSAMLLAVRAGSVDTVRALLDKGVPQMPSGARTDLTPLSLAQQLGNRQISKLLAPPRLVTNIIKKRYHPQMEYLVEWNGGEEEQETRWEPAKVVREFPEILAKFDLKYDAFLSHRQATGQDLAKVVKLELELRYPGIRVFLDRDDLEVIQNLSDIVRDTANVILLVTDGALDRPFVQLEIATALALQKNMILLHDEKSCFFPSKAGLPPEIHAALDIKAIPYYREKQYLELAIDNMAKKMESLGQADAQQKAAGVTFPTVESLAASVAALKAQQPVKPMETESSDQSDAEDQQGAIPPSEQTEAPAVLAPHPVSSVPSTPKGEAPAVLAPNPVSSVPSTPKGEMPASSLPNRVETPAPAEPEPSKPEPPKSQSESSQPKAAPPTSQQAAQPQAPASK
eukprot:TRINITY_DN2023_c0_g1_i1.p1 TRINITY_DN2023_c0_g1~~TRINITY_DN2023_c0_g1_i1.p1  ORF type:complete len:593 (+),score=172.05 TRINITY_DN2023_c0_g1_i1:315-2093(+)